MSTLYALIDFYGLRIHQKCLSQHHSTSNHLRITKIERSELSDAIVKTIDSQRQLEPGTWKIPIKQWNEKLTNFLSALQEISPSSFQQH